MKKLIFVLLYAAGVTRFAAWWNRKRVVFLCYHGVTERTTRGTHDPHGIHVPVKLFEAQLDYLRRRYRVVSLRDYLEARRAGRHLPRYCVVLTFDDGFRNFLTAAAPRLAARRMPASLFIITNHTAETNAADAVPHWKPTDDWRHLSWTEVQMLTREQGIEIGSHTCSHSRLPTLSPEETERELRDSYESVVAHIGRQAPALSYPKGEYSAVLSQLARSVGYACAVTVDGGANDPARTDPFALGRTLIGDEDDRAAFAVRVSGVRDWLAKLGSIFSPHDAARGTQTGDASLHAAESPQSLRSFARRNSP
jgi:peptidoglycan/xylan/chitin deacetylase (PgdA/CDA1 family)